MWSILFLIVQEAIYKWPKVTVTASKMIKGGKILSYLERSSSLLETTVTKHWPVS